MGSVFDEYAKEITEDVTKKVKRDSLLTSVRALMQNLNLTAEQAMNALNVSEEDRDSVKAGIAKL